MPEKKNLFSYAFVLLLLLVGLTGSLYLTKLDWQVTHGKTGGAFCDISEKISCSSVAESHFAKQLGIPIAVYGVEFYLVALFILVVSYFSYWPQRKGESLVFLMTGLAIPFGLTLLYISEFIIHAFCIVCGMVHGANLVIFLFLGIKNRRGFRQWMRSGLKDLLAAVMQRFPAQVLAALFVLAGISQFFWMPPIWAEIAADAAAECPDSTHGRQVFGSTMGSPNAPVRIEVFTDFQCPYCKKGDEVLQDLLAECGTRLYVEHHDFPLGQECNRTINRPFHEYACGAALYARCAARQNRFWEMAALLFENNRQLRTKDLDGYTARLDLDQEAFRACLADPATAENLRADIETGIERGVSGTPTFFVNRQQTSWVRLRQITEAELAKTEK